MPVRDAEPEAVAPGEGGVGRIAEGPVGVHRGHAVGGGARQGIGHRIPLGIGGRGQGPVQRRVDTGRSGAVGRHGRVVGASDVDADLGQVSQAMGVGHAIGEGVRDDDALGQGLGGGPGVVQGVAVAPVRLDGQRSVDAADDGGSRNRLE